MSNIQTGEIFTNSEMDLINGLNSLAISGANQGIAKISATTFENRTFSSGAVGPGTINEIAYFDTANTVASLAVATYPSLTELSYIKGLSSAIQTQLGGKLATGLAVLLDQT